MEKESFFTEIFMLKNINHPNIVQMYDYYEDV